jgi:predicted metal-dependent phosphoesterase TrpH
MNGNVGGADLHTHTTASDGTISVAERIAEAQTLGLDALAITDHDVIADDLDGRSRTTGSMEVITGVEVRADVDGTKVELLGYYVDLDNSRLQDILETVRRFRCNRNRSLVRRISEETGLDLDYKALAEQEEGNLGRPHVADQLVEAGVVDSVKAAFDEYLADDTPCFVPMERLPARDVIDGIRDAGGVTSLAHPGRIRASRSDVASIVETLAAQNLDGIEVYYPYSSSRSDSYADIGIEDAAELATEHDLLVTGGSDCHGPGSGKHRVGEVRVPHEDLTRLRDLARTRA